MKKTPFLVAVALCAGLANFPAAAAYVTGADLSRACRGGAPQEVFSCLNYIAGVIDYHVIMQSLGTAPTIDFCLPESLPLEKAAVAVMLYLKSAPQHGEFIAAPAVAMALHEKFPCAPAGGKK